MAVKNKDLEGLRKEHKDLSDQITRSAVLVLSILCVLVISFTRACRKVSGEEVKTTVCQINNLGKSSGKAPETSFIFKFYEVPEGTCKNPCQPPSPASTPETSSTGPSIIAKPAGPTRTAIPKKTASPTPSAPPENTLETHDKALISPATNDWPTKESLTEQQRDAERDCQTKLEASLEGSAQKWYGVKPPVPGVDFSIDLRYWIFILPPLFFLSGIYLHISRRKLSLIKAIGRERLRSAKPEEITDVDRLYFEPNAQYLRFPGSLAAALFLGVYLFLPVYLAYVGASLWRDSDAGSIIGVVFVILILTFYAVSYGHFITNRIDRQILEITDHAVSTNLINRVFGRLRQLIRGMATRLSPRLTLFTGSLLIMATLVMTISQNSCEHKTFKGYEVALGKREAHWNTAYGMIGDTANPFYSGIARTVYIIAILISIFLFCAALSSLYSSLQSYRIRLILLAIAGSIFVFSVIDFSLVFGVAPAWETGIKMMIWVLIAGVWIRYSLTRDETKRQRWLRIRAPLSVFSTPFFLLAVFYVLENLRLPGLIAFFIGNIVLFLGLLQTHFRHTPASPGASTGQQTVAMEDPLLPL